MTAPSGTAATTAQRHAHCPIGGCENQGSPSGELCYRKECGYDPATKTVAPEFIGTAATTSALARLRDDHAARIAAARAEHPTEPALQTAQEIGFLTGRAEWMARDLDRAAADLLPKADPKHWTCASTFCGQPVTLEYDTYTDSDRRLCIEILGVWLRGVCLPVGEEEIAKAQFDAWEQDCERHQGWHYSSDDDCDGFDQWVDSVDAAAAAEDRFIAQRDHAHYSRAAA